MDAKGERAPRVISRQYDPTTLYASDVCGVIPKVLAQSPDWWMIEWTCIGWDVNFGWSE